MPFQTKITLILLQTLDGFIAKNQNDNLDWGSPEDKQLFAERTKKIGLMICGSNTYLKMNPKSFEGRKTIVVTSRPEEIDKQVDNVEFFTGSPAELKAKLSDEGIAEAALVGGGKLNGAFLQENLVDEIYISLAPVLFGTGVRGYGENQLFNKFELISNEIISPSLILLHYKKI